MPAPTHRRWTRLLLVCALPALTAAKCRKDRGGDEPTDEPTIAQGYDVDMAVVSISPSVAEADTPLDAAVRGAGFGRGARVWAGSTEATSVEFVDPNLLRVRLPGLPVGRYDVEVMNPDGASSTLRQGLSVQGGAVDCEAVTVYFALDASDLTDASRAALERQLACYRDSTGPIRIEGHCDERGTIDYNLALGDRRARSVSRWLAGQGVDAGRIATVSYGEEKPAVTGSGEDAWSKNRRAEIRLGR